MKNCKKMMRPRWLVRLALLLAISATLAAPGQPTGQAVAQGELNTYLPFLMKDFLHGAGTISGRVLNSTISDTPIDGARVCLFGRCSTTDSQGYYTIESAPAGWQPLQASNDDFYTATKGVNVRANQTVTLNFALSPIRYKTYKLWMVLTWDPTEGWESGDYPGGFAENDLDSHLWVEAPLGGHISQEAAGDCTINPYACLEVDQRRGFGPETLAISEIKNDAIYHYGVLNFNAGYLGVPPITQSSAVVEVFNPDGLVQKFAVPGKGTGNFWYIFSMDATGAITTTNCITTLPEEGQMPSCP